MARKRMLDPSIWDDEDVGSLSPTAFKLFIACISNADDDGKLNGAPRHLRGLAFRFNDDITVGLVEDALIEIDKALRSFMRYEVADRQYILLMKWQEYQTINKPSRSKLPDPTNGLPEYYRSDTVALPLNRKEKKRIEEKGKEENSCALPGKNGKAKPTDLPDIDAVFDYYKQKVQPAARNKPTDKIRLRLKTFTADELRTGIDHFAADAWWMETNASRGAAWFFHSDERIEGFLNMKPRKESRNGTDKDASTEPSPFAQFG